MTSKTSLSSTAVSNRTYLRRVRRDHDAEGAVVKVRLFMGSGRRICGWFIGSLRFAPDGIVLPYLPRSEETLAPVAIVRAIEAAEASDYDVCVVDPDNLWDSIWHP